MKPSRFGQAKMVPAFGIGVESLDRPQVRCGTRCAESRREMNAKELVFSRFDDGVIQAAFLRAALPTEPDFK